MLITKEAFNELINCPIVPPEMGGDFVGEQLNNRYSDI